MIIVASVGMPWASPHLHFEAFASKGPVDDIDTETNFKNFHLRPQKTSPKDTPVPFKQLKQPLNRQANLNLQFPLF